MTASRRTVLKVAGFAAAGLVSGLLPGLGGARAAVPARHAFATIGEPKRGPGFGHFDHADPAAPKGGTVRLWFNGSFDSLHPFILKGIPAAGSNPFLAGGSLITFESLMLEAGDGGGGFYGLVAETVELPDDRGWIAFNLDPRARFHDGSPITAADVVFSFEALKQQGYPVFRLLWADVETAVAEADRRVVFRFRAGALTRDLPASIAGMPILSQAWFADRPFDQPSLEAPLASGPYRAARVDAGRSIVYERVKDHWAADLPVNRGRHNFDAIRYDYYLDRDIALEALFAGKVDFREEFTSRDWATKYDVPPVQKGLIRRESLPDESPSGTQGWFLNSRRPHLADPRVRRALAYGFDFEWTNQNLFYGLYSRTRSIFENSHLAAREPPTPAEIALLEPFRGQVPAEVFEKPYEPPATDGSGNIRPQLRAAFALLREAGWTVVDGVLRNAEGADFTLEFLNYEKGFERITLPFIRNLERLGIQARFRVVEPAQYQNQLRDFDFDVITSRFSGTLTPGRSLANVWGSEAADLPGSANYCGIRSAAVDALIERIMATTSREDLTVACRALDRVVMWGHHFVPQWYKGSHSIAYWDMFGRPAVKPSYALGFLDTWWIDPARRSALDAAR